MSKDYFALYESPNIVIVPTVTSTTRKDLHPTAIGAAVTESSTIQQIVTEEPKTFNLFVSDRHVPTSVGGNISCVDTSTHFDNLNNLPLIPSIQHEVTVSYSKYSSHNNLVDLTCLNNLNTNETPSKSISNLNISQIIDNGEDTKPIEQKEWGLYHISRVQDNNIYYNSLVTDTYPNTVTNNNMNPITESNSTEQELKLKHMSKHEKGNSGTTISQSPKKRSYHESNSENSKKQEDEKEVGLKQRKVLNPVLINKKNNSDQQSIHNKSEYISKHNLISTKSASIAHKIDQKNERESTGPNEEFLHVTLSEAQKSKLTAGALKRYLDYQRFLAKYYNTFDKKQCGDEKNTNTCNKDLKLSEKRINNNSLKSKHEKLKTGNTVERKHEKSNVKANVEKIKSSSRDLNKTSNAERKQNKEESKRKRYEDKREINGQSTSRKDRKNKEEDYNEKSMKRMEKKEELKIKFTSYCQKKKKKSIEGLDKNKIETDQRYAQCSDRKTKKKHDDEVIDSSKDKKKKEETILKLYDNSEIKRMKEETKIKSNKTKETGLKRKITDFEPDGVKKYYKRDSASVIGSCQSNSEIESRTLPKRTVDVKEKATFQNSCKDKKDLRSKLSRKITKSQYDTESTRFKLTPTRENLIVTVKQDVLAAPSSTNIQSVSKKEIKKSKAKKNVQTVNKKEIKKPKDKKSKKIKLVINIKCPNSEDSDGIASETSTSPHPDLSFLDDLDIDGIVDSLNAGQSPIPSNVDVEDSNTANNCDNISPGPLEKDCPHVALHEPDLLHNTGKLKERSITNADTSLLSTSHTNENIVEECNDDIYEIINITDDSDLEEVEESTTNITQDMSIIYIDDDSRDEAESTNELKNKNKVAVISENPENVQNIVAENNKHNVTNVTDIGDNKIELPDVKYLVTQTASVDSSARTDAVETKSPVQEVTKIKDFNIKVDSNTEDDKIFGNTRRIKSENLEEPPTAVQNTSKTIQNEKIDGIIVKTEDIEKSQKVLIPSSSIQECMNNNIANTIVNTKSEPIENLEKPQNVATSNSNVREEIRDGVDLLKTIKNEQSDAIVKTEEKYQNDLTTSSNIHEHNEVTNTVNKPIANMNTAITIKSERSSVPVQPNIDDINLAKVMTAENVNIIKESSLIVKISEDRVIKQNSSKERDPKKHSAEITVANNNKPKGSEKLEAKNTKKQAKPGDVIISKSKIEKINPVTERANVNTKNNILNMFTNDKLKKNIAQVLKKKIPKKVTLAKTEVGVIPIKSEAKDIVYWNKIEQRMFEYLQRKFFLIKLIHKGYFSSIYTCKNDKEGIYAIKILKCKFQSMAIYKDKMLTDLQKSTDRKRHFLLEMINSFNIHGEWCFLSEYYPKTLEEALVKGKKKKNTICFHIDMVQNLSRQLVAAVCMLTSNLLVHSDIKPAHILLNSSHTRLKLCGFDRMDFNYNINIIPSTGTASYRAPEIIMGFEADYKIDVWSTALVMFEMASGFKLFPGCFNNDILYKQVCTLGPMPYDMIENSFLAFIYFYGTKFMKQIGTSDWVFVPFTDENYRVRKGPYTSYHTTWAPSRSHLQITEDLDKIEMLHRLLQIMLVLDPRHRIPITYVAANEFIFHNDMIPY